jgi:predicted Zn-dependent protease
MTISTKALGNSIGSSELESIAKHGIGHALGIGHTLLMILCLQFLAVEITLTYRNATLMP